MTSGEPKWRQLLNWAAVISFFAMPVLFFLLELAAIQSPWFRFEEHLKEFAWTRDYFRVVCLVVVSLAGLNSWDRFGIHKNGSAAAQSPAQTSQPQSNHKSE